METLSGNKKNEEIGNQTSWDWNEKKWETE